MQTCNCGKHVVPTAQVVPVNCEFVIPASYPYVRPAVDSYECCCCPTSQPSMKDYPTSGPYKGNAFALDNANPYLIDTTSYCYGQALDFAENIYTKITKRDDPSCINLTARFDFTDSSLTNTVRFDFLRNYTARKYEELSGVLPIIKNGIKFRIHYTIYNIDGGVEYIGHTDCKVEQPIFHFTSIKDVFVQSSKGLIIDNIPAMTYQGKYTISINNIEAFIEVINTKEHLQDPSLNPFYTFEDNNRKILLHNTEISGQAADDVICIGECAVNQSFEYLANISTRLRMNFIAFTSLPIACGDTSPIWFALNEPTEQSITQLRNEVSAIEEELTLIHAKDAEQDAKLTNLEGQVELNRQNIATLTSKVAALEAKDIEHDLAIQALEQRVTALESIPLALVVYKANKEIKVSQLTWKGYGQLYQAAQTFYATGDFDNDVRGGYLIPVAADSQDISELAEQLRETTETADNALTSASATAETVETLSETVSGLGTNINNVASDVETLSGNVSTMSETVSDLNTTVTEQGTQISTNTTDIGTLNETVGTISTSVAAHSEAITANATAIETNSGAISELNTVVTALNEDVDDLDARVADLEHPIDPQKINVRKISDLSVHTFNNMTDAADYINADDAEDDEKYDLIIGPQMPHSTYTEYQRITSSKLRDVYNNGVNSDISPQTFYGSGLRHFYWGNMPTDSVISIGQNAFSVCANMTSFEFPENVESITIGNSILTGCSGLTSLTFPSSVKTIASGSQFGGCTSLTEVYIDSAYIAQAMFNGAYTVERVTIGPHVTEIHAQAFPAVPALTSITIPSNVTRINNQAFVGCTALETAVINISGDILQSAFAGCTSLANITLGEGVTEILDNAFSSSVATTIDIPSTVTSMSTSALAGGAFETINVHQEEGALSGAPWGATDATVNWLGS